MITQTAMERRTTVTEPMEIDSQGAMPGKRVEAKAADRVEAREGAHHEDVAVGEVDELDDAVDHRVAEGYEGVDEAELESVQEILQE
jgi:hypothetical protein